MKFKQSVDVGSIEKLSKILGAFDENLNALCRELSVVAYVDGVKIIVDGEEHAVEVAVQVLDALCKLAETGEKIDFGRTSYCIELAKEGRAQDITNLTSGVVAVTARGRQVKCKTVGQKEYVDAIKNNSITFGVGPAGTGKTYLAVGMAVSAFKSKQVD